jgi:Bacterial proteasome activator
MGATPGAATGDQAGFDSPRCRDVSATSREGATMPEPAREQSAASPGHRAVPERPSPVRVLPAEVVRISTATSALAGETRQLCLDEATRKRLAETDLASTRELEALLPARLAAELERLTPPFADQPPTQAELRVAQAQLLGWLEGLFGGIHLTLLMQETATDRRPSGLRQGATPPVGGSASSNAYR